MDRARYSDSLPKSDEAGVDTRAVRQAVVVLGSTGSIGCSTLDVLGAHPERFSIYALAARRSVEQLAEQCARHRPRYAAIADESRAARLQELLAEQQSDTEVLAGEAALEELASAAEVDTVVAGIVGAAGLPSSMAAVRAGKKILLANKETLVIAGALFVEAVERHGATLLPIDSEHNAIFQCLPGVTTARRDLASMGVKKLLLTGSGGPFRDTPARQLAGVTPAQACAHPNWSMGRKISVDSATMMNKGLELIEACWLFQCSPGLIDIVIHPQSIVHSMVEYVDGSVLAQLGSPDMRTPIAHALAWPQRIGTSVQALDWTQLGQLSFAAPDLEKFPSLGLARDVAEAGGSSAVALNAANEVAVEAFLDEKLAFTDIVRIAEQCLQKMPFEEPDSIEHIQELDARARRLAAQLL